MLPRRRPWKTSQAPSLNNSFKSLRQEVFVTSEENRLLSIRAYLRISLYIYIYTLYIFLIFIFPFQSKLSEQQVSQRDRTSNETPCLPFKENKFYVFLSGRMQPYSGHTSHWIIALFRFLFHKSLPTSAVIGQSHIQLNFSFTHMFFFCFFFCCVCKNVSALSAYIRKINIKFFSVRLKSGHLLCHWPFCVGARQNESLTKCTSVICVD